MNPPAGNDPCFLDGLGPLPVLRPSDARELGDVVRQGRPLYPVGGGTQLHVGLPPTRPGVVVDMTAFDAVIDYPARDMTITVGAGIRMERLGAILAEQGQRLPLDIPSPHLATLGGSIAANVSGSRRYAAGTLRDYVIGISTVGDTGEETRAGGRVVKNVAGYDLCKLHTGAFGTLGIITQVTLKVRPVPESQALVLVGCDETFLPRLLDLLHKSDTRPVCIDALSRPLAQTLHLPEFELPDTPWSVIVGFEENEAAVEWQLQHLFKELTDAGLKGAEVLAGASTLPLWKALTESPLNAKAVLTHKASLLPGKVGAYCAGRGQTLTHAHAGSGIVWGHELPGLTEAGARTMLEELLARADGDLTLPRCPTEWKRSLPVWGRPRGDLALMRKVKQALDPRGLFNPGRFLDAL